MNMEHPQEKKEPHVLIFPLPAQGHINSMLRLARLLCLSNFRVTFVIFDIIKDRLLGSNDIFSQASQWPGFQFTTISDGLPPDYPRSVDRLGEVFATLKANATPLFKEMLISYRESDHPVTCVIADGMMSTFAIDGADDVGIPIIVFRTASACSFWCYFNIPKLIQAGEIPFRDADIDKAVTSVEGMERILRLRDLPRFYTDMLQATCTETLSTSRASALILNTFEDLEGPVLTHIRTHCSRQTYTIGPIHGLLQYQLANSSGESLAASGSLWKEDRSCIEWLDSQPPKSVLYISFGSSTVVNRDQLLEFWHGLVDSQARFLWVIRPDLINGTSDVGHIPEELQQATRERGFLIEWAPQEDVLAHSAVGGFLTHSGWNSTVESVFAGVPMMCWPFLADQQVNSRYVELVWRVGLDMKDTCERGTVERMVRELMQANGELRKSMDNLTELARKSVRPGGSSYMNFARLVDDIRRMSS